MYMKFIYYNVLKKMGEAKIIGEDFDNFKVTPVRNHVRVSSNVTGSLTLD